MSKLVDATPIAADRHAAPEDEESIKTEEAPALPSEEQKADAFLAALLNFWAMLTGKVKEIDESAGISTKAAELDEKMKLSQALKDAKEATLKMTESLSAKLAEMLKGGEKEWVAVDEKAESNTAMAQ